MRVHQPPQISYDESVPPLPVSSMPAEDPPPRPPAHSTGLDARARRVGGCEGSIARVEAANGAARVEPRREGYFNAVQVFPYSPGALYQVYVAPGQVTDIALEPGEQLTGSGPVAAGDTVRWIIGDTESGNGDTRRVHILVKPPGLRSRPTSWQHRPAYLPHRTPSP